MAKILLVEDDPLMVRMYQRKLVNDGYETVVAVDGEEGLVKVRSFRPDLVLLDIMMPKLNGLQVLERLKSDPTTAKTPVIILTNLGGTQDDIERGLELGAVAYLVKSAYRPDEVIAKVKEILEGYTRSKEIPKAAGGSLGGAMRVLENTAEVAISSVSDGHVDQKIDKPQKDAVKKEKKLEKKDEDGKKASVNIDLKANEPQEDTGKGEKELQQKDIQVSGTAKSPEIDHISSTPSPVGEDKEVIEEHKPLWDEDGGNKKQEAEEQEDVSVGLSEETTEESEVKQEPLPQKPLQKKLDKPREDAEVPKKKKETDGDNASTDEMVW